MSTTVLDIETGSEPDEILEALMPEFEAPGNYKDPEKIAANIADQKAKWKERSALSPISGKVLAVGLLHEGSSLILDGEGDERVLLEKLSKYIEDEIRCGTQFVGFSIHQFDVPYLRKRMWKYGIKPFVSHSYDPFRQENFIDLQVIWDGRSKDYSSLDSVSKFLGIGQKNGDGKDFAKLWVEDREKACQYIENDLNLIHGVGQRMGVIG